MSSQSSRDDSEIVLCPGARRSLCTHGGLLKLKFIVTAGHICDKFTCSILEKAVGSSTLSLQNWKQEVGKVSVSCEQDKEKPALGLQQLL